MQIHISRPLYRSLSCSLYHPPLQVSHWVDFSPRQNSKCCNTAFSNDTCYHISRTLAIFAFTEQFFHVGFPLNHCKCGNHKTPHEWEQRKPVQGGSVKTLKWSFIFLRLLKVWKYYHWLKENRSRSKDGQWSIFKVRMGNTICTLKGPGVLKDKRETTMQTMGLQQEKPPKPADLIT